ncbi:MAG: hypothetical protein NT154_18775 [Verrucomicrobia bacterium]|nr:hypothetical protein [Verrucomicrobiota bacterium]
MTEHVFVVCATCCEALALEWDPACFLVDDPLGEKRVVEGEIAQAALLHGIWPGGDSAPTPLAAGVWEALATRAVVFVRRHLAHPDSASISIAREQPVRTTLVPAEPFAFPVVSLSASSVGATGVEGVRGMTLD